MLSLTGPIPQTLQVMIDGSNVFARKPIRFKNIIELPMWKAVQVPDCGPQEGLMLLISHSILNLLKVYDLLILVLTANRMHP